MSIFKKRQKQVKENKDDVLSNLDKFKNKKIPEDIKLDSTSAMDLYKEAIVLGDCIINQLKKTDAKLKKGITINQYDIFMRLAMCIIKVSIMDYSKYTSKQIEILERVFSAMCIQAHTFSLMARFNIDRIYGEPMNIIEQRYQEKLDFCEYIFISSEDHSISNYLQTPSLIFGFDYKNDGFFEISKFMDRINNKKSKPSNDELIFTVAVMNGYTDFINKNKNQLNNTVKNILKKYV